jgi:hypothetical protein
LFGRVKSKIENDVLPALILTFSPEEKEQLSHVSGFADGVRQIQSQVFQRRGERFSLSWRRGPG